MLVKSQTQTLGLEFLIFSLYLILKNDIEKGRQASPVFVVKHALSVRLTQESYCLVNRKSPGVGLAPWLMSFQQKLDSFCLLAFLSVLASL